MWVARLECAICWFYVHIRQTLHSDRIKVALARIYYRHAHIVCDLFCLVNTEVFIKMLDLSCLRRMNHSTRRKMYIENSIYARSRVDSTRRCCEWYCLIEDHHHRVLYEVAVREVNANRRNTQLKLQPNGNFLCEDYMGEFVPPSNRGELRCECVQQWVVLNITIQSMLLHAFKFVQEF